MCSRRCAAGPHMVSLAAVLTNYDPVSFEAFVGSFRGITTSLTNGHG
jgi:hypothetical protein